MNNASMIKERDSEKSSTIETLKENNFNYSHIKNEEKLATWLEDILTGKLK